MRPSLSSNVTASTHSEGSFCLKLERGILRGFVLFCQHLDSDRAWKMRPFVVFFQGQEIDKTKRTVVEVGVVRELWMQEGREIHRKWCSRDRWITGRFETLWCMDVRMKQTWSFPMFLIKRTRKKKLLRRPSLLKVAKPLLLRSFTAFACLYPIWYWPRRTIVLFLFPLALGV